MIPGADEAAKLRFLIVAAGGAGVVWGLGRWLRKEDLGTTTKTILKTQKSADQRAAGDSERLRHLEGLVQSLQATLESRLAALPGLPGAEMRGEAAVAIAEDLSAAVHRLAAGGMEAALSSLAAGDERAAIAALADMRSEARKTRAAAAVDEAELAREQGAIAFLNDTHEAMRHYTQACELDPANARGWNKLGLLQQRAGNLDAAARCYERVMAAASATADEEAVAMANGNLGAVIKMRGDTAGACETWREAHALFQRLGMRPQIEQVERWMREAGCAE